MDKAMFLALVWFFAGPGPASPAGSMPQEKPVAPAPPKGGKEAAPAATLEALLRGARAALAEVEAEKSYDRLPAVEAEWAGKIEKFLLSHPGDPALERAACFLAHLEGGVPEGSAMIRALYDRIKDRAAAPWFEAFLREIFYQLHGKDPAGLLAILADAEPRVKEARVRAALLYYRALTLAEEGKAKEARPVFERIPRAFPGTPYAEPARGWLQELDRLQPGMAAPPFKLPGLTGGTVDLAAFKGKVVVLFFWTSRCPLLEERAAALREIAARHKADPFAVAGICLDPGPDRKAAEKKAAELGMTWPCGFDGEGLEGPAARAYATTFLPRTFLVDGSGGILSPDLFLQGDAGFLVNDAVIRRKAEIQKAEAAKKQAEGAKPAAPPKQPAKK